MNNRPNNGMDNRRNGYNDRGNFGNGFDNRGPMGMDNRGYGGGPGGDNQYNSRGGPNGGGYNNNGNRGGPGGPPGGNGMNNGRNDMGMGGGPGGPGGPGPRGGSFDDPSEEDKVVCRLLIPTRLAGALIGKRGETVNRMRMEFNCEISIPTSTTSERTLRVMSSEHKSVVSCIKAILDEIGEDLRRSGRVMEEEQTELRLLMHTSHAGYVIGQGGKNIKQLRTDTNCRIIINTEHCPYSTDRVCQISGTAEDVMSCVDKVLIMVDETPIKGEKSRYNANFANDKVDYGGYKSGTRRSDRRFGSGDGREALEDQRMNYNGNNNNGNGSYNGREDDGQNNRGRYNNNNNRNDRYFWGAKSGIQNFFVDSGGL